MQGKSSMPFFISVGRHEAYERSNAKYPITPSGIADAWLSGPILEEQSAPVDVIYTSPLPRAKATAVTRGMSIGCGNIIVKNALHENSAPPEVWNLVRQIISQAEEQGYKHLHLVTHQPVVSILGGSYSASMGSICLHKGESLKNIIDGKTEILTLGSVAKQLYALQFENPEAYDRLSARYAGLTALAQEYDGSFENLLSVYAASESQRPSAQRFSGRSR